MRTNLNFEDESTKILLTKYDFGFYLERNIDTNRYKEDDIKIIYDGYKKSISELKVNLKNSKNQNFVFLEGKVRKMFSGGFIPALFELDETRELQIFDFAAVGKDWAYFYMWRRLKKRKITISNVWTWIIKTGSILAIILTILKIIEMLICK